jgi:protein TonB
MNSKENIKSKIEAFIIYIKGQQRGTEAHDIESEATTDAFLYEALEGIDAVDANHAEIIDSLHAKIMQRSAQRHKNHRKIMLFGTAASINAIFTWSAVACVSVIFTGGLIYFSTVNSQKFGTEIAISENATNEINFRDDFLAQARKSQKEIIEEEFMTINIIEPPMPAITVQNIETENMKIIAENQTLDQIANFDADSVVARKYDIAHVNPQKLEPEELIDENIPFAVVEEQPKFMGKDANFFKEWVQKNLKYPDDNYDMQGKVMLSFIIDIDGNLTNVTVVKKLSPEFDAEAVRVVSSSPKWTPAKQMRSPVKFEFTFPVSFALN